MTNSVTVHDITSKVPSQAIRDRFGVKDRSIRLARERGMFPASWYRGMRELCAKYGAEFSDNLFNWKSPDADPATKGGDASADIQGQAPEKVNGGAA